MQNALTYVYLLKLMLLLMNYESKLDENMKKCWTSFYSVKSGVLQCGPVICDISKVIWCLTSYFCDSVHKRFRILFSVLFMRIRTFRQRLI